MTDKQMIIDGVDVSECIYYQYNMCTATKDNYGDCSFYCKDYDMNDCYYKQLKRKEQECEQLKDLSNHNGRVCNERLDEIDKLEHNINELNKQLDKSEAENKKLKKTLEVIASRPCLNLYDCTGHCLPNCKWNAHVLAQQTLKEIISEVEDDRQD